MVTRLHFDEEDPATELAEALDAAGFEVAVIKERFAGEDDDEEIVHVVCTPASRAQVESVTPLPPDVWVETD